MIRKLELSFAEQNTDYTVIGSAVNLMLNKQLDVLIVRNAVKAEDCNAIADNFYHSSSALPRADNVPGIMLGVSHYFKTPADYYHPCEKTLNDICALFNHLENPILALYEGIGKACHQNIRAAIYNQKSALFTRGIQWTSSKQNNGYMLQPHDDVCQVFCERNHDWEIQDLGELLAVNFYAKTTAKEGKLRIFDFYPSDTFLKNHPELIGNGYPYSDAVLADASYDDIAVNAGDILILNGKFVHAVTAGEGSRLVLNSFIGKKINNSGEIIYWS